MFKIGYLNNPDQILRLVNFLNIYFKLYLMKLLLLHAMNVACKALYLLLHVKSLRLLNMKTVKIYY